MLRRRAAAYVDDVSASHLSALKQIPMRLAPARGLG
jgi:hypothetical protein